MEMEETATNTDVTRLVCRRALDISRGAIGGADQSPLMPRTNTVVRGDFNSDELSNRFPHLNCF